MKELYGIEMGQGSISNILDRMKKQSNSAHEAIRLKIEQSRVVGADETGECLDGTSLDVGFSKRISYLIYSKTLREGKQL